MVIVFLAQGFEEIEALSVVDVLRRARIDVVTVGIGGRNIVGSHGIEVVADIEDRQATDQNLEAVVLPGGLPGADNLKKSDVVRRFLDIAKKRNLLICAICAAPYVLGHHGLLKGVKAVCYPGYEKELTGAVISREDVVYDKNIITAKGAGVALQFALKIVSALLSPQKADEIGRSMQCR